jgi:hypothetical protein
MLRNGMHGIFDVKTGTNAFPLAEIIEATSEENGAWATMTSTVDIQGDAMPVYAVSHRRGESVKAFVSTCGTTLLGAAVKAYFEDDEERAMGEIEDHEVSRKAPAVLNDFTVAQPTIDRHNRYRQHLLAMEKRFITNNFSFRFFTSMLGTLVVNVFMAHRYFNDPNAEFKVELDKLGLTLVNNVFIDPPSIPKSPASGTASPGGVCDDGEPHWLVPLRSVEGLVWKKGMQRRCRLCSTDTIWVCGKCTTGPLALWPLCSQTSIARKGPQKGKQIHHPCLSKHRLSPTAWVPRCKHPHCGSKRAQGSPDAPDPNQCPGADEEQCSEEE